MSDDPALLYWNLECCRRVMILSCGNPSRGDDGIGPWLHRQLHRRIRQDGWQGWIRLQESVQWQPEDALSLNVDDVVFFIDADQQARPPYRLRRVEPGGLPLAHSHGLSPEQLLTVVEQIGRSPPLAAWQWGVPALDFELGKTISTPTREAGEQTLKAIIGLLGVHAGKKNQQPVGLDRS